MLRKITKAAILGVACSSFFAALAGPARADHTWNVASGDWSFGSNWNPVGVPLSSDNAFVGGFGTAIISHTGEVCQYLDIGTSTPGTVSIAAGNLTALVEQPGAYITVGTGCSRTGRAEMRRFSG